MYTGQFIYCGRRATLSIGDVLPLRGILEGAIIYNVEHHVGDCGVSAGASRDCAIVISHNPDNSTSTRASRDYAIVISRNPDNGASARASGDYAIVISRNPDNGASAGASRDYAIIISHNPDNDIWARGASHRRKAATNDSKADDAWHPPVPLLLWRQQALLSKGGQHHLIYVG